MVHSSHDLIIIAGGLATGAETPKTEEQRISFGGFANASLDPCYHRVSTNS